MSPAARGTQRFCPECGAKVTKTQKFCRECGADLSAPDSTKHPATPAAPETVPPPPSPPLEPTAAPWPAWAGAAACGALAVAVGLPWIGGGFGFDGFDVPLAALFSDTVTGGPPIAIVLLVAAAAGLAVGLISPSLRALGLTLVIVGTVSTAFLVWYVIRVLSLSSGAPLFDVLSVGVWVAVLASLGTLAGGIVLRTSARRAS